MDVRVRVPLPESGDLEIGCIQMLRMFATSMSRRPADVHQPPSSQAAVQNPGNFAYYDSNHTTRVWFEEDSRMT